VFAEMKSYSWNANANPAQVSSANSLFEKGTYAMNAHTEWWSTFFSGLSRLLEETGFSEIEGFGSTAGEPFQFGSRDCYLVAMKA